LEHYRHTQIGVATILAVGGGVAVTVGMSFAIPRANGPLLVMSGILLLCLVLFGSLTVVVDERELRFWFGPGLIRRRFYLTDVRSCEPVTNAWAWGWGIHRTPRGWLYNVSGLEGVEIGLSSGQTFRLGTDEPHELCRAFRAAARLPGSDSPR